MTYLSGSLIEATDYNGFVSTNAGANLNATWGTATSSAGYGQTALGTVSTGGSVTAAQWASLNNTITSAANHQGTSITSRTSPGKAQDIIFSRAPLRILAELGVGAGLYISHAAIEWIQAGAKC